MNTESSLPQATGLTLPLEQAENVSLTDRALDITDNRAAGIINELNADLGDITSVAGAAENTVNLGELYGLIL